MSDAGPSDSGSARVYRVTVRGRFTGLTDAARRRLVAAQPEHDLFLSAFTEEGTFSYDDRIQFFNLRYEVRLRGDAPSSDADELALLQAEEFLRTLGIGATGLRAATMDMSAMVERARRDGAAPSA